ncbi:TldD/PmbA family protein [Burkholderia vietnamiensis]|uniref:TldD/PmbA family protein n=1 Tax=Burkholderia vietnamiensis TaxID=60552 RepID=UPI000753EB6C|nr:metallopeptidase TldD-related protein [Burkholderia vietnamiensis]KVE70136.1 peptidase U62 [Burkholderia vietnamiensis]
MHDGGTQWRDVKSSLEAAAERALDLARRAGADGIRVEVDHVEARTATVRNRMPTERSLRLSSAVSLVVYRNGRRGATTSSDLSPDGLAKAVAAAIDIASVTDVDAAAGLAQADLLAKDFIDLDLYHPLDLSLDDMLDDARRAEEAAFSTSPAIVTTNGASVGTSAGLSLLATSEGFAHSVPWSAHFVSCMPVAAGTDEKQMGFWSDGARAYADLDAPAQIGAQAATRALALLGGRQIETQRCPVLFEPMAAMSLLGEFVNAASGDALYRTGSYLTGRLDTRIFADHIEVCEDPFVPRGMASRCFDADGIAVTRRSVVEAGVLRGYFLGLYAARRLGMTPTGNGWGAHNLEVRSANTAQSDGIDAMLARLDRGLFVTEMAGGGVNRLTGDFSRAAKGFWVENGQIRFPVTGITIASNLDAMFSGLLAVGADTVTRGSFCTGSWLIDEMRIGGS